MAQESQLLKNLEGFVQRTCDVIIRKILREKYLISRKAVIISTYYMPITGDDTASIRFINSNASNEQSIYRYPNRTGRYLSAGEKVYLVYQNNNISQGWLEDTSAINTLKSNFRRISSTPSTGTLNDAISEFGFDYDTAGSGLTGSYISFSGLGTGYPSQIVIPYGGNPPALAWRSRNGDTGAWNMWSKAVPQSTRSNVALEENGEEAQFFDSQFPNQYLSIRANSFNSTSDRKLKENFKNIEYAKDLIMKLKPLEYNMLHNGGNSRIHLGLVSQDVYEVLNELNIDLSLVSAWSITPSYNSDGSITNIKTYYNEKLPDDRLEWGLNYSEFIAPLIKVVQEQQSDIDKLKEDLLELKNIVDKIIK